MKAVIKLLAVYYYTILIVIVTVFCMSSCATVDKANGNRMQCTERR